MIYFKSNSLSADLCQISFKDRSVVSLIHNRLSCGSGRGFAAVLQRLSCISAGCRNGSAPTFLYHITLETRSALSNTLQGRLFPKANAKKTLFPIQTYTYSTTYVYVSQVCTLRS